MTTSNPTPEQLRDLANRRFFYLTGAVIGFTLAPVATSALSVAALPVVSAFAMEQLYKCIKRNK